METVGLFRRTAAKARVEGVREAIEANPGMQTVAPYLTCSVSLLFLLLLLLVVLFLVLFL